MTSSAKAESPEGLVRECPHCGGAAAFNNDGEGWHQVICGRCGARGPETRDRQKALLGWNRRAPAEPLGEWVLVPKELLDAALDVDQVVRADARQENWFSQLGRLLNAVEKMGAAAPAAPQREGEPCRHCKGRGYSPGGNIYDAAGGVMDAIDDEECPDCKGTGKSAPARPAPEALVVEQGRALATRLWEKAQLYSNSPHIALDAQIVDELVAALTGDGRRR